MREVNIIKDGITLGADLAYGKTGWTRTLVEVPVSRINVCPDASGRSSRLFFPPQDASRMETGWAGRGTRAST